MVGVLRGNPMNIMTVNGYKAKIEYDPELDQFRGEIIVNGKLPFHYNNPVFFPLIRLKQTNVTICDF